MDLHGIHLSKAGLNHATAGFTEIDVAVCLIILATTVSAFLRGFVKESLSLASYIGAGFLTLLLYPSAVELSQELFKQSVVMSVVTVVLLFLFILVFFSVISAMVLDNLREFRLGVFDRSLGLLFGLAKGFAIVGIVHYGIYAINGDEDPKLLTEGQTYQLTKMGSDMVENHVGDYVEGKREKLNDSILPAYGGEKDNDDDDL